MITSLFRLFRASLRARRGSDMALARDEASRFLPWLIAVMVYLAALVLAGGLTLHQTLLSAHSVGNDRFSVHLPYDSVKNDPGKAVAALKLVQAWPNVASAELLTTQRIRALVEPWLGQTPLLGSLPLPTVIEATLTDAAPLDVPSSRAFLDATRRYDGLKEKLHGLGINADIDDHRQWMGDFTRFILHVQRMLFFVSFVIIAATATMVVFACKTSLKIHKRTVQLLHRLGARDGYIAAQFQRHAGFLALKGAFIGSGLAAGTLFSLHATAARLDSPLLPSFALTPHHLLIFLCLPLVMGALALASARLSVLASLKAWP